MMQHFQTLLRKKLDIYFFGKLTDTAVFPEGTKGNAVRTRAQMFSQDSHGSLWLYNNTSPRIWGVLCLFQVGFGVWVLSWGGKVALIVVFLSFFFFNR